VEENCHKLVDHIVDGNHKRPTIQEAIHVSHKQWLDVLHHHHEKVKDGGHIYKESINEYDLDIKHKGDEIHEHNMKLNQLKHELEKAEAELTYLKNKAFS
jgi:chromosome segregation ATPase